MAYQVLARKWRPQDFSSVVGQESTVTALRNALSEERIAQAYLFSGIRGVGKTSVARVLAKALNCEKGPASDPCNECQTCVEITAGSDLDVIEVDAATYSKVEQVRELTESLKYGPARDRYKVVVIDEIHRLSRQAFDALLKIVEEPPPHLVFIFATTEADAVPATILSRCQEFRFRRVRPALLAEHLRMLAAAEEIEASDTSLRLIARAGEGSVRDSVALLDQLATLGSGKIADDDAARVLGGIGATVHHRLLSSILDGSGQEIAAVVGEIEREGWDPRHVYGEFLAYCRDALHLALGTAVEDVELPEDDARKLADLAADCGYENLLRLTNLLLASEATVRRSEAGALAVEIAWLRAAELPKVTSIESLLSGGAPPSSAASKPSRRKPDAREEEKAKPAKAAPRSEEIEAQSSSEQPLPTAVDEPTPADAGTDAKPLSTLADQASRVDELLTEVSRLRQPLAAHLNESQRITLEDDTLVIYTAPSDQWLAKALARGRNRKILEEAIETVWGKSIRWRLRESAAAKGQATVARPGVAGAEDAALKHPVVQTALDIFGGTARTLENEDSKEIG